MGKFAYFDPEDLRTLSEALQAYYIQQTKTAFKYPVDDPEREKHLLEAEKTELLGDGAENELTRRIAVASRVTRKEP